MKFLIAFAALLLAMTSVAVEAAQPCEGLEQVAAAAKSPTSGSVGDADCHDATDHAGADADFGCAFAAHCALLCGATTPAEAGGVYAANFVTLLFFGSAERLADSQRKPEAPPPRSALL